MSSSTSFDHFKLCAPILRALKDTGYKHPTPIQEAAIPLVMEGKDLLATAQTGTGKTAAFGLPMLQRLQAQHAGRKDRIRALILAPTRELALQIEENLRAYGKHLHLRTVVVMGGVSMVPQINALRKRPDILVATPGRLLDLQRQGHIRLEGVEMFVLDEADRMLDMGFIHDVRKIVGLLPTARQTMLFSATLSDDVCSLAASMLKHPARVQVTPPATVVGSIVQQVFFVDQGDRFELLVELLKDKAVKRVLVFTRTKRRADRVAKQLTARGISADAIHSNKSQGARQRVLSLFHSGKIRVLVGTDVVARGIDVDDVTHVINYEIPEDAEVYVHRIGRTARAGANGIAQSFCSSLEDCEALAKIEKLTGSDIAVIEQHPFHSALFARLRGSKPSATSDTKHGAKPASKNRGRRKRWGSYPMPKARSSDSK